jgi:LysR family transcriptional regulator, nitrogen assimilation regulatory protein
MPVSSQVTLKQLRYFARIVELGSISRASQELHVAQTALGLQVRALEESLGATLLVRHPKGVQPTEMGSFVYTHCQHVLGAVDSLVVEVQKSLGQKSRDVWLGLAPNFMAAIGTQALLTQAEVLPDVDLHLTEASRSILVEAILDGDLNWAITHEASEIDGIASVPILRQSLALITRAGEGPKGGEIELRDAIKRELVLDSGRRVVSGILINAAQLLGVTPNIRYQVDSTRAIKDIIRSEGLSGVFVRSMVREELERGELEAHSIVNPPLEITAYFIHDAKIQPTEQDRPFLEFIDALIDKNLAAYPVGEVQLGRVVSVLHNGAEAGVNGAPVPKVSSR